MFFRRQNGRYREMDRVTRYKLIKSGKHWLRASTSLFGLFKVLRGGVDTTQVMTEVVEDKVNPSITGLDIIKGLAATGAVLGGSVATQTKVFANETVAVEKTLENPDLLVTNDTAVLGTTSLSNSENSASLSTSVSESTSISESVSTSTSASASASTSVSASASTSSSASASSSDSASTSTSLSQSASQTSGVSTSVGVSSEKTVSGIQDDKKVSTQNESKVAKIDSSILKPAAIESNVVKTNSDTTSLVGATAATLSSVETSVKKNEENRKKLTKLSAEMGEYLAKAAGLPNTDSAITKVNAAVTAIEKALANPTSDWTEVVQKATLARNSIVNAVLRAQSGARDARNGQAMLRDTSLRASWATAQNDGRMTVSSPGATFDKATGIATYTMNVQADSALSNVGVRVNVGRGGHVQSATFNGYSMEKTFTQGSEIVYNYRHGQNRNLSGRIEVKVKYDNNVPTATADMQVQVSSAPIGQNTQGNASRVQSASVSTGYRQQPTNNQTTSKLGPQYNIDNRYKEVYNGDSINDLIGIQSRSNSNIYIYGADPSDPVPGVNYVGNQIGVPGINRPNVFSYLQGTVGGNDLSAQIGKEYTYNFSSGQYNGQVARDSVKFLIKGFNERHEIQSGNTVQVSDLDHLTPDEVKEVYNNFVKNPHNLTNLQQHGDVAPDVSKGELTPNADGSLTLSYPGTKSKIVVSTDGKITVTYRDGSQSEINANLEKEKEIPDVNVSVTRNGEQIKPVIGSDGNKYYYVYAGDDFTVDMTATDNKGKLREFKLVPESDGNRPASDLANNFFKDQKYGKGTVTSLSNPNGEIVATPSNPARITATGHMKDDLEFADGNHWRRNAIATDKAGNYTQAGDANKGNFFIKQGRLADIMDGAAPTETFQVDNISRLNPKEKARILSAVEKLNNKKEKRIDSFTISDNGTVTIIYKDRTTDTVTIKVSDSDYKSRSTSTSVSQSSSISASKSASTSASQSASTSASKSASTSASKSVSTSASQSASTSASKSASTSASKSASTSASKSASTSASQSASTSASKSASTSASQSASTSASKSASTSASQSASTSASKSASTSASQSASTSASKSASTSASQSASTSASQSASTSASQSASTSASESASTSASQSASTSASESASTSASQSASTSASESASTSASQSASTSASESASTSASQSASTSASESASTSASQSASTSASESASTSASESASTSASESASTSASESASTSASESASTSASESASTSASESASTSASESASTSASESASTSASESASTSASESASTSASESASTSASESASTSASESASTSASESASTSASESASTSASESASTSASESASTSASESASTSASESASTSASESANTSASESASTSASESASTSASESASTSASESASTSASESASTSASESASTSASESASTSASESASTSASESASTSASESASTSASESAGKSRQQLPNTGTEASKSSVLLGALAAVTGLGMFAKRRKRDDEE